MWVTTCFGELNHVIAEPRNVSLPGSFRGGVSITKSAQYPAANNEIWQTEFVDVFLLLFMQSEP